MIKAANKSTIGQAAQILREGGLVGMPTETVYGLAANALDGDAVAKIFAAKGRPAFNPLIIHVPDLAAAADYVEVNEAARAVARAFWPGPLTVILPKVEGCAVSELASAGLETLAVRVPAHKVALELLRAAGVPVAAPSANKSGSLSPTSPAHVHGQLGDAVDMILAAGVCSVGLESTVLDLSGDAPVVLRPGGVSAEALAEVLGEAVAYEYGAVEKPSSAVKSPGMLLKHYAPNLPVRLNAVDVAAGEALLAFGSVKFMGVKARAGHEGHKGGCGGGHAKDLPEGRLRNLSEDGDLHEAAANLFAMLKELDESDASGIAVMAIPDKAAGQELGRAINDRLARAAER
jgi:L-threonylcarbamoyladenylate synthase